MAVIVNTINDKYFSLNGHPFAKIYQPLAQGTLDIGIYSIYDTRKQIQSSTPFGEYVIDGSSFGTQALTIQALLDVVYKESEGGDGGVDTDEKVKASATDLTPNNLLAKIAAGNEVTFETLNAGGNEQIKINAGNRPALRIIDNVSQALAHINYQVNTDTKAITAALPTVTTGDKRRYFFTLETDTNQLTMSVIGGTQLIGENATLILSGKHAYVELAANGQDGYFIVSNTESTGTESSLVGISDPATESIDGLAENQQQVNQEVISSLFAIRDVISEIAGAAATIAADPKPQQITNIETPFTFVQKIASTNPDIIEIDGLNDQLTIKAAGVYQFATFLNVSNGSNSQDYNLTLTTKDTSDDEIITQRTLIIPKAGYSGTSAFTFEVQEADVPLTLDFYLQGSAGNNNLVLQDLESTVVAGVSGAVPAGLAIVGFESNDEIRALQGYSNDNDAFQLTSGAWYKYDELSSSSDNDDTVLKPNNKDVAEDGRWLKKETFLKASEVNLTDYENILFESLSPDFAAIIRGFDFKISTITTYDGSVTVFDSSNVAYVTGATVTAGDYLKVYGDTLNMRAAIIIQEVIS